MKIDTLPLHLSSPPGSSPPGGMVLLTLQVCVCVWGGVFCVFFQLIWEADGLKFVLFFNLSSVLSPFTFIIQFNTVTY